MNEKLKLAGAAVAGIVVTLAAGSLALASVDHGIGPIGHADADNDGYVTKAEWLKAAEAGFTRLDANKDGKLAIGEIPRGPGPGHHHGPGHGPGDDWNNGPPPPPPADEAPANAAEPAPAK